ncbi:Response regulator [Pararobbsia alpina]|uniref:response regulator transcription factor n=1 Tax=Pararobbsia alpina TaxID=621374 RepID=UPI0039A4F502
MIDDESSVRRSIDSLIRSTGHRTRQFDCAEAFIALAGEAACDCVVTDVQMGGMSGVDLLAQLRERGSSVPCIVVTAHATADLQEKAQRCGALCVLKKPVHPDELVYWISVALGDA